MGEGTADASPGGKSADEFTGEGAERDGRRSDSGRRERRRAKRRAERSRTQVGPHQDQRERIAKVDAERGQGKGYAGRK